MAITIHIFHKKASSYSFIFFSLFFCFVHFAGNELERFTLLFSECAFFSPFFLYIRRRYNIRDIAIYIYISLDVCVCILPSPWWIITRAPHQYPIADGGSFTDANSFVGIVTIFLHHKTDISCNCYTC